MKVDARLLPGLPLHRYTLIDIRLMYDLGNQLRLIINEIAARRRDFRSRDGICGAVFEEEGDERAEGVEEEADYHKVDNEEDDGSAPHRVVLCRD